MSVKVEKPDGSTNYFLEGNNISQTKEYDGSFFLVSQRVLLNAFGTNLNVADPVDGITNLLPVVPFDETGSTSLKIPVVGALTEFEFQPDDSDVYTESRLVLDPIVGAQNSVTSTLVYRFRDAGKSVRIRTVIEGANGDFDIYGTSNDPYLYFTTESGDTVINFDSPIPVNIGLTFNSIIETTDGTALNILGKNGSNFEPYGKVFTQSFELVDDSLQDQEATGFSYLVGSAITTISSSGTPTKIEGVTAEGELYRFDSPTNNRLRYLGDVAKYKTIQVNGSFDLVSGTFDDVTLYVYFYDDSEGTGSVLNYSGMKSRITFGSDKRAISTGANVLMDTNDYIEVWIANEDSSRNILTTGLTVSIR